MMKELIRVLYQIVEEGMCFTEQDGLECWQVACVEVLLKECTMLPPPWAVRHRREEPVETHAGEHHVSKLAEAWARDRGAQLIDHGADGS